MEWSAGGRAVFYLPWSGTGSIPSDTWLTMIWNTCLTRFTTLEPLPALLMRPCYLEFYTTITCSSPATWTGLPCWVWVFVLLHSPCTCLLHSSRTYRLPRLPRTPAFLPLPTNHHALGTRTISWNYLPPTQVILLGDNFRYLPTSPNITGYACLPTYRSCRAFCLPFRTNCRFAGTLR
jgi:hypothetical protein